MGYLHLSRDSHATYNKDDTYFHVVKTYVFTFQQKNRYDKMVSKPLKNDLKYCYYNTFTRRIQTAKTIHRTD